MQSPHSNQPVLYFSNFNNLLDFPWVIEIFHSSTLVIMRSSAKYNKPNQKVQGDLALGMSCFSQFVTSSARLDTVSLKSIKRILGGEYLKRANALLLPRSWRLPMTRVSRSLMWGRSSSLKLCPNTQFFWWDNIYSIRGWILLRNFKLYKQPAVQGGAVSVQNHRCK